MGKEAAVEWLLGVGADVTLLDDEQRVALESMQAHGQTDAGGGGGVDHDD
jgi:hypothetical protein